MIPLNLPAFNIKIVKRNNRFMVFDPLRRRYITLTPEEWVRQHFTNYLIAHLHYPPGLLANEISLNLGGANRRCDTVLYHRTEKRPQMIIEYKAPQIPITQEVFNQITSYNSALKADYLVVSNGVNHYCCKMNYTDRTFVYLKDIPTYELL
jgi:hypothetical protein